MPDLPAHNTEPASAGGDAPGRRSLAARVMLWLIGVVVGLVLLHLLTQALMNRAPVGDIVRTDLPTYRLRYRLLNLDREMSLPAWFSSLLLANSGGLMLLAAWVQRVRRERGVLGWGVLAIVFLGLSIDESAAIHEVFVDRVRAVLGEWGTGLLFYAWYVPFLLLGCLLLLVLVPFLKRLPRRTLGLLALAVGVYLIGAAGFESVMGLMVESTGSDEPPLQRPPSGLVALVVLEEGFEMLGAVLVCYAMLAYLSPRVRLSVVCGDSNGSGDLS